MKTWLTNNKGQTSLIMIVIAAMALIFFAATLNWGRVSQTKTQVTIASNSAASALASGGASYGEMVLQETLGGRPKYCKSSSILQVLVMIVVLIVVIIVCIIFHQYQFAALVLNAAIVALALSVVNLALQLTVLQPGLTRMWNRLQKDLPIVDQFIEGAVQSGMVNGGGDQALLPDYFDMDSDGRFKGNSKDMVGRFGFFYIERSKLIKPPTIPGLDVFLRGMNTLTFVHPSKHDNCAIAPNNDSDQQKRAPCCRTGTGLDAPPANCSFAISDPCTDDNKAECNSCCVPLYDSALVANPNFKVTRPPSEQNLDSCMANNIPLENCNSRLTYRRLRPAGCSTTFIPREAACANNPYGQYYQFAHDPASQQRSNTFQSFLEQVGRDDEHAGYTKNPRDPNGFQAAGGSSYQKEDATGFYDADSYIDPKDSKKKYQGVFPLLHLMKDPATFVAPNAGAGDARVIDRASSLDNGGTNDFHVDPPMCSDDQWTQTSPGIFWKEGAPRYCSSIINQRVPVSSKYGQTASTTLTLAQWPYHSNCAGRDANQTCNTTGNAQQCNECSSSGDKTKWPEDPLDDIVYGLGDFTELAKQISGTKREELVKTFEDWYPEMARWIAPQCPASLDCSDEGVYSRNEAVCNHCQMGHEGLLRRFAAQLGGATLGTDGNSLLMDLDRDGNPTGGWYKIMDNWLKKDMSDNGAWCSPKDLSAHYLSPDEKYETYKPMNAAGQTALTPLTNCLNTTTCSATHSDCLSAAARAGVTFGAADCSVNVLNTTRSFYKALRKEILKTKENNLHYTQISGTTATANIKEVVQCLKWNETKKYSVRFDDCLTACKTPGDSQEACYNMPRSTVSNFVTPPLTVPEPTAQEARAIPKIRCLENCAGACSPAIVHRFNRNTMCDAAGPGWIDTSARDSLLASIDADYSGTACANYSKILQSKNNAIAQEALMTSRYNTLNNLQERAEQARDLFKEGNRHLRDFLFDKNPYNYAAEMACLNTCSSTNCSFLGTRFNETTMCNGALWKDTTSPQSLYVSLINSITGKAPAQFLINARRDYKKELTALPSFGIYGWQSEKKFDPDGPEGPQSPRGRWHIVRVEALGPTKCGGLAGCASRLPWVRTYSRGFMNRTRCFVLTSDTSNVGVRVTRYDESGDTLLVKFNNQAVTLWRFMSGTSPGSTPADVSGLSSCTGSPRFEQGASEGISVRTQQALRGLNTPNEEYNTLNEAFMINNKKSNGACLNAANALLDQRGIKTSTCARYELQGNHMGVRFINCPAGAEGAFDAMSH